MHPNGPGIDLTRPFDSVALPPSIEYSTSGAVVTQLKGAMKEGLRLTVEQWYHMHRLWLSDLSWEHSEAYASLWHRYLAETGLQLTTPQRHMQALQDWESWRPRGIQVCP